MAGNAKQKLKLLYLQAILREKSDEKHPLSSADLGRELEKVGIQAQRKSIYSDIDVLRSFGMDILNVTQPKRGYYLATRGFELPQVRLLMDAVRAADFITEKKSKELIHCLSSLVSEHQGGEIQRQIYINGSHKHTNEEIYYSIDAVSDAIAKGKKIELLYHRRQLDEQGGICVQSKEFTISPYALMWMDDHYYLVGNHEKYSNLMHLRIDRMKKVTVLDDPARSFEEVCEYRGFFDTADYASKIFHAFGGETELVELRCRNAFLEEMLDCFGEDITIRSSGKDHFTFQTNVAASEGFVATLLSFGDKVEVLTPRSLRSRMAQTLFAMAGQYG